MLKYINIMLKYIMPHMTYTYKKKFIFTTLGDF